MSTTHTKPLTPLNNYIYIVIAAVYHYRTPLHSVRFDLHIMYYSSPISNISPALVSVAMSRSDSRDSTMSQDYFTSAPMQISYSTSPMTCRSNSAITITSSRTSRESFSSPYFSAPYSSCQLHRSSSSQGSDSSSSAYVSDDDLLSIDDLIMPPTEHIPSVTSAPQYNAQDKPELSTEEQIALLNAANDREQAQIQQQRLRAQQQRAVRFAAEQRKPRRPSNLQRRSTATRRT